MILKNKNVLIYGLATSGRAAARLAMSEGARVFVFDDNEYNDIPSSVTAVSNLQSALKEADLVILSPSIPLTLPVLADAVAERKVTGELEFAYRFINSELIAVTGTNGKTTVTLLINEMVNRAGYVSYALGNVGIPLAERVKDLTPSETAVVEVSTFQLETCKEFSPDIAVLTNVTSDHIDRHGCRENYVALKEKIFAKQVNRDYAVLNADDATSVEIAERVKSDKFFFSRTKRVRGCYAEQGEIFFEDTGKIHIASVKEIAMLGEYNLENVLAASAACMLKGINPEIIRQTLKFFSPPEYRLTYVGEKRGKKIFNDSKATNVSATLASSRAMDGNTVLILGGRGKGENYTDLFKNLPKNVIHAFVTGENSPDIIESALKNGWYNISHRASLWECVNEATCVKAENVLFSPASSSYDSYADYRDRGRVFDKIVGELS